MTFSFIYNQKFHGVKLTYPPKNEWIFIPLPRLKFWNLTFWDDSESFNYILFFYIHTYIMVEEYFEMHQNASIIYFPFILILSPWLNLTFWDALECFNYIFSMNKKVEQSKKKSIFLKKLKNKLKKISKKIEKKIVHYFLNDLPPSIRGLHFRNELFNNDVGFLYLMLQHTRNI